MKKLILPIIILLTVAFFSPQKADAQTDAECFREYQNKAYKCLQKFIDCTKTCTSLGSVEAYNLCANNCSAQDKTCSDQASSDLTACKAAIKKDSKNPPKTEASPEVQASTDCHEAFNKESNSCLKESTKCLSSCVDKANDAASLTVDGGKVNLKCQRGVCDPVSEACNNKVKANFRACQDAGKQPAASEAKKKTPKQETKSAAQTISDWIMENDLISDPARLEQMEREKLDLELYGRTSQMTEEIVKKAREEWEAMFAKTGKESVVVVNGHDQLESPGLDQFISVTAKDDPIYYTYFGEVVSVPKRAEIKFLKPVWNEKTQELKRMLKLNKGEVEIKVKNDNKKDKFGVQGDFFDLFVIQTHFWVNQSQDKNLAVIGVYEGEVEVKTKDGQTIKIKPDGNKPGVVVVTQKLSVTKLTIVGLLITAVIGGVILILKRKFTPKGFNKKKR